MQSVNVARTNGAGHCSNSLKWELNAYGFDVESAQGSRHGRDKSDRGKDFAYIG